MRYRSLVVGMVCGLALLLVVPAVMAQDLIAVAPKGNKVKFENKRVRVLEVTMKPGEKVAMHSHPDHVIYFMTPAHITLTMPDGKVIKKNGKQGDVVWAEAETHMTQNTGKNTVKLLVMEMGKRHHKK